VFVVTPLLKIPLPFVGTLIEKRYWEGLRVFPVVLLAQICNGAYANFMVGVYLQKKTGLMPLVTGAAAVVNVAGNFLLIPIFGMMAAAWTTFLSYFTLAALLYFLIQRHYYIKYEWKRIGIIVGCGGFVYLLSVVPFLQDHWPWKLLLIPLFFMALKTTKFFLPEELAAVRRRFSFSRAH
jgi:O-antigen/teichoic acid export membrane protein